MFWILYKGVFILYIFLEFGLTQIVKVTELNVPTLVDPQDELQLGCRYDMGNEELYSVKWYKDEQEFFRYTPRQQPHIMSFPVAGVHLVPAGGSCTSSQCTVRLSKLSTTHSSGSYRCEVSTEAPAFRVAFAAGNVTVAAIGKHVPRVEGLRDVYAVADLIYVNCTAAPADPAPFITWLLNGQPAPALHVGPTRTSPPDARGLITVHRDLRFHADRRHFSGTDRTLKLQCTAIPPSGIPSPPLSTTVSTRLYDPQADAAATQQRNVLGNQKFAWPSSTDRGFSVNIWLSLSASLFLLSREYYQ